MTTPPPPPPTSPPQPPPPPPQPPITTSAPSTPTTSTSTETIPGPVTLAPLIHRINSIKWERKLLVLCKNNEYRDPRIKKFNKKVIRYLVLHHQDDVPLLKEFERALDTKDPNTRCMPMPRDLNSRLLCAHRRVIVHVLYIKLWRWPDVGSHHQVFAIPTCMSYVRDHHWPNTIKAPPGNEICVNPYHWTKRERPAPIPMNEPGYDINVPLIPPDLTSSEESFGSNPPSTGTICVQKNTIKGGACLTRQTVISLMHPDSSILASEDGEAANLALQIACPTGTVEEVMAYEDRQKALRDARQREQELEFARRQSAASGRPVSFIPTYHLRPPSMPATELMPELTFQPDPFTFPTPVPAHIVDALDRAVAAHQADPASNPFPTEYSAQPHVFRNFRLAPAAMPRQHDFIDPAFRHHSAANNPGLFSQISRFSPPYIPPTRAFPSTSTGLPTQQDAHMHTTDIPPQQPPLSHPPFPMPTMSSMPNPFAPPNLAHRQPGQRTQLSPPKHRTSQRHPSPPKRREVAHKQSTTGQGTSLLMTKSPLQKPQSPPQTVPMSLVKHSTPPSTEQPKRSSISPATQSKILANLSASVQQPSDPQPSTSFQAPASPAPPPRIKRHRQKRSDHHQPPVTLTLPGSDIIQIPYVETESWCTIEYHEMELKLGDTYRPTSNTVVIDGFDYPTTTSRMNIANIPNPQRLDLTDKIRMRIGKGVRLINNRGVIYVDNLSKVKVFVSHPLIGYQLGDEIEDKVTAVEEERSFRVFDIEKFRQILAATIPYGFERTYKLIPLTRFKISFVKGWTGRYKRQSIKTVPCWLDVQLHGPMSWIDRVLRRINLPGHETSSSSSAVYPQP